jgi:isoleucyl-tRNA synthetase
MRYEPVDPKVHFPALEERILSWWRESDIFARTLALRADAPVWRFYEGPPTANGMPGIHHVEPRTFKDVYPRYKTMTGHLVPRKRSGRPASATSKPSASRRSTSDAVPPCSATSASSNG